jgi:hypothetical protein
MESRIRASPYLGERIMTRRYRLLMIVALAIANSTCGLIGPSVSLAGNWSANYGGKFGFLGIVLDQSGDEITGTACYTNAGQLLYEQVPVRGDYPHVRFDVANGSGARFSGRRDSTGDIVGVYQNTDVRFRRSDFPVCP